jgi:phosphoglycolate phosphatase-like HAD superfamily hydrolase
MKDYKLYLFDLDGTLADMNSTTLYPDAQAWLNANPDTWMICTNQGGVGLRHWMETNGFGRPEEYPTEDSIWERFRALFPSHTDRVLVSYAYQSQKSRQWSPTPPDAHMDVSWSQSWRKPDCGMLNYAMTLKGTHAYETLMVGDREEDQKAAEAAACDFMWAWHFFGRETPD